MTSYRITKYNPDKRNDQGHYLDDSEWTAISDIENPKYNNITYEEYEMVESAYVSSILLILQDKNFDHLVVETFLRHDKKSDFKKHFATGRIRNINLDFDTEVKILKKGLKLNLDQVDKIVRLILRETVDLTLANTNFEIRFGYDYYMYVETNGIMPSTIEKIEELGLFVEPEIEQIKYTFVDEDGNEL
jgi:hypothetical protein